MFTGSRRGTTALATALIALTVALGGCSSAGTSSALATPPPGVTDDTISLGVLTDLTGPFASRGTSITQGQQLYVDRVNAGGGVCGRELKLVVKDHSYDVSRAVAAYQDMRTQVLGIVQLFGSGPTTALLPNIGSDRVISIPTSRSTDLLKNPYLLVMGATYDVESINTVDFLVDQRGVRPGDRIGHVHLDNEYGQNAFTGTTYAAKKLGLTVREATVRASDTTVDFAAEASAMKQAKVRAVLATVAPSQLPRLVAALRTAGVDVPVVVNSNSFFPESFTSPGNRTLAANVFVSSITTPASAQDAERTELVRAYRARFSGTTPDESALFGYGTAAAYVQILRTACSRGTLTRDGLSVAVRTSTSLGTAGTLGPLDLTKPGSPSSRATSIEAVDPAAPGAVRVVRDAHTSTLATSYRASTEIS